MICQCSPNFRKHFHTNQMKISDVKQTQVFSSVKASLKFPDQDTVKTHIKLFVFCLLSVTQHLSSLALIKHSLMIEHFTVFVLLPETVGCSCLQACTLWAFQWSIKKDNSKEVGVMLEVSVTYQLPHSLSNSSDAGSFLYDIHK